MPGANFAGEYGAVKSKEAILEDNAAMAAILRSMRVFTLLLVVAADSDVKPAGIPINIRPPFRFEAGHDSNQLPAGFRH